MTPNLTHLYTQPSLPLALFFFLTTALLVAALYAGLRRMQPGQAARILAGMLVWLGLLGLLAGRDFFLPTTTSPPRFVVAVFPPVALGLGALLTPAGRRFYDGLPLPFLTALHTVRLPVELTLYGLMLEKQVPELMTFGGSNPDILVGLTAPVVAGLAWHRSGKWLRIWHLLGTALLGNIVFRAILAAPTPLQQWAFEQPNVGVLKFPFIWLPGFIVPLVLLGHLAALRQLFRRRLPAGNF